MILATNVTIPETNKSNKNTLIIGVPGSGKTRSHVIPNLMEMDSSFVVIDPKGEVYDMTHELLYNRGYHIEFIDFDQPEKSESFYNPLMYLKNQNDIIAFSEILVCDASQYSHMDPFWNSSGKTLCTCLASYLIENCNEEDYTLANMLKIMNTHQIGSLTDSTFDIMMQDLPDSSFAKRQYNMLRVCGSADKTIACIFMELYSKFNHFMTDDIIRLTSSTNTVNFSGLGKCKTALFIKCSDTDRSKDKLIDLLIQQAVSTLCHDADELPDHCLKCPVHFFLDDMGTGAAYHNMDNFMAGARSRGLSFSLVLHSEQQLKKHYPNGWQTILSSCLTYLFLGSNELETCEAVAKRMNCPLLDILSMNRENVLVFIQGQKPIKAKKYDMTTHNNYCYVKDSASPVPAGTEFSR